MITQWVRFQYTEELSDSLVRTHAFICSVVMVQKLGLRKRTYLIPLVQKRQVLSDPTLPPEFRLTLAQSLRHDLFFQAYLL
jgi:hypothetical protein